MDKTTTFYNTFIHKINGVCNYIIIRRFTYYIPMLYGYVRNVRCFVNISDHPPQTLLRRRILF